MEQSSANFSRKCCKSRSVLGDSNHTHECGSPSCVRYLFDTCQHELVIRLILRMSRRELVPLSIAGGADARFSIQRVDGQAGIVSKHKFPSRVMAVILCLQTCIGFEAVAGLGRWRDGRESGNGKHFNAMDRGSRREVTQLAWVRCSYIDPLEHGQRIACKPVADCHL